MCIVVDTNVFAAVFTPSDRGHAHFKHVFKAIDSRKAKMTVGGTKYRKELAGMGSYTKLLSELSKAKKLVSADDAIVDALEAKIEAEFTDPAFNDKHIVALTYVSHARLVCTKDRTLQQYIKSRESYNRVRDVPKLAKIYGENSRPDMIKSTLFNPLCRLC